MYKQLFILLFNLIAEPEKTWKRLAEQAEVQNERFYKGYLYPTLGVIAASAFLGSLISLDFDRHFLSDAIKIVIKQVAVYFGGFYLASFLLNEYVFKKFRGMKDNLLAERFVGYSSALIYAVAMTRALFPELFFLWIIVFYSVYIIWQGAVFYLFIDEDDLVKFTGWSSAIILFTPIVIEGLIWLLLPGMRGV